MQEELSVQTFVTGGQDAQTFVTRGQDECNMSHPDVRKPNQVYISMKVLTIQIGTCYNIPYVKMEVTEVFYEVDETAYLQRR